MPNICGHEWDLQAKKYSFHVAFCHFSRESYFWQNYSSPELCRRQGEESSQRPVLCPILTPARLLPPLVLVGLGLGVGVGSGLGNHIAISTRGVIICQGSKTGTTPAACCRLLLVIQFKSSYALFIALFLPEWEERGETANYSPTQHIIHTLKCEPMEQQMIFCFKIIRFISTSALSRISHHLRFSFSRSTGVSFPFSFLQVWGFVALCQCCHTHTISIDWIDSAKVLDAIELEFIKHKVKNLCRGKTKNLEREKWSKQTDIWCATLSAHVASCLVW